jgi:hypothetical protein
VPEIPRPSASTPPVRLVHRAVPHPSNMDGFDCQSTFQLVDWTRDYESKNAEDGGVARPASFDYGEALRFLADAREKFGFGKAQKAIAFVTSDPASEPQARFFTALTKRGILVQPVDYRHAMPTLPIGTESDRTELRLASVTNQISYLLGLLAGRENPEIVLVTRCFEIFGPLTDFVANRGGKAMIAFFRRFMDGRWAHNGLFDPDSPIKFVDLEPVSKLLLGVDIHSFAAKDEQKGGFAAI